MCFNRVCIEIIVIICNLVRTQMGGLLSFLQFRGLDITRRQMIAARMHGVFITQAKKNFHNPDQWFNILQIMPYDLRWFVYYDLYQNSKFLCDVVQVCVLLQFITVLIYFM